MSRPIPETHESRLKKVLEVVHPNGDIDEATPLPQDVQDLYWQCEQVSRKFGRGGISDDVLLFIAVMSGAYSEPQKPTFLETAKLLDRGENVEVKFRGEFAPAVFLSIKGEKIVCKVGDDAESSREFNADEVRLPEGETLTTG